MEKSLPHVPATAPETPTAPAAPLLPLGALMLAASFGSLAQTTPPPADSGKTLPQVVVKEKAEAPEGKDAIRATTTTIGKGTQELRNVPQSITVVTEKLIDDRNLETMKDVLRNTAGVSFQAAEGGEEDIRLRGFSLAATGDIFLDGMRDPAFYDRDTFNNDRVELLRGSASMLFGRGSTGGAVNQVSKAPRLGNDREFSVLAGNHDYRRVTGDVNVQTGEDSAVRLNLMRTRANDNGSGSTIDKEGAALGYRWGIGGVDEITASAYYLNNDNGINYGLPWIRPNALTSTSAANTIIGSLKPTASYGMASDYNAGLAKMLTLTHLHRFDGGSELRSQVRRGQFQRDLRASAIRFAGAALQPGGLAADLATFGPNTVFTRGTNLKIQDVDTLHAQSDYAAEFSGFGYVQELKAGVDYAQEQKTLYAAPSAAQGGITLVKPTTLAGTPDDGAFVPEASRSLRDGSDFVAKAWGAYVQDLVQVAPAWKVLAGLRYDNMDGRYRQFNQAAAGGPITRADFQQVIGNWSKRFGVLYQPDDRHSYHFSYGTSFNTSGDTYSYNALSANTPPEQSRNIELGARIESADKRVTTRLAAFHSTKFNERNTDPDTAATRLLLSGKRHTAGIEIDVVGRITPRWEVFVSYMWMPIARVDDAASTVNTVGNMVGDRPGLTPKNSGTAWTTYQFTPKFRAGGGVNFRSRQAPADVTAPGWQAPGFATLDLMAEYALTPQLTLKGNIVNVADKLYADSLYRGHYIPGAGRLVQVGMIARF